MRSRPRSAASSTRFRPPSTELEAAAGTLTKTAETTQQLSGMVATASEEASANVQSVATATEELTSSVHEIAARCSESSRIAGEAVQAGREDRRAHRRAVARPPAASATW